MTWLVQTYTLPLARPYKWAKGEQHERRGLLVSRHADGLTGWGETAPPPHEPNTTELAVQAHALLPYADATPEPSLDRVQAPPRLRHAILGAWLDLEAKRQGTTLAAFLAQRYHVARTPRSSVPVNALIEAVAPEAAARLAVDAVHAGYRTLKVKSDGAAGDVARLSAIRDAVGPGPRLRLDANESWKPSEALAHLRVLDAFGIEYVEQPVRAGRLAELVDLCRTSPVPIALDESVTDWAAVQPYLDAGVQPILILKPQRLGGPDRTLALMGLADAASLTCVVTNSLESAVGRAHALHLAALLPDPVRDCGLATHAFLARDVAQGPTPVDGALSVPTGPGLGIGPVLEEHAPRPG